MKSRVLILGAGPSGLSCALWLDNLGYSPVILETAPDCGGMLRFNHHLNDWLLGFSGATGKSICDCFIAHVGQHDFPILTSAKIVSLAINSDGFEIEFFRTGVSEYISSDFLVVASGTSPVAPIELMNMSSKFPKLFRVGASQTCVEDFASGQRVAILGGGDNAFENAWLLAKKGVCVDIFFREDARARNFWKARCSAFPERIFLHPQSEPHRFEVGVNKVEFWVGENKFFSDVIIVMYGYSPNTKPLTALAPMINRVMNDSGFIEVDQCQRTAIRNLYAVGDVTDRPHPCLPSAISQGSIAAKAIALAADG